MIDSYKNAILDYEDLLISTLGKKRKTQEIESQENLFIGFGIAVRYPHECIIEAIGKIRGKQ